MNEALSILFRNDRKSYRPGETLEGVAGWHLDAPPHSVELRLFWYTRGKGTDDIGIVQQMRFDSPQVQEERRFSFVLPAEPYSFSGQLISLIWALELIVEPGDRVERAEFVLSPSGQEILLHSYART